MNHSRSLPGKTNGPISNNEPRGKHGAGEVAGGTAAECMALFCCLPCTLMNIVVLVLYKAPVGLCRKAIRTCKGKPQAPTLKKNEDVLLDENGGAKCRHIGHAGTTLEEHLASEAENEKPKGDPSDVGEMDAQMWASFDGTGFWRSQSQKLQSRTRHSTRLDLG